MSAAKHQKSPKTTAQRLRAWRLARGLTYRKAAELFGCHETYVSLLERGMRDPGRRVANAIEAATNRAIRSTDWDAEAVHDTSLWSARPDGE